MVPFSTVLPGGRYVFGALLLALACRGALLLLREGRAWALGASAFAASVLFLHMTWSAAVPRYALPLVPITWIFALTALKRSPLGGGVWGPALAAACALSLVQGFPGSPEFRRGGWPLPATLSWLSEHVPSDASIQTFSEATVRLRTGRAAVGMPGLCPYRDAWLGGMAEARVDFVLLQPFLMDGLYTEEMAYFVQHVGRWAGSSPFMELAYHDEAEGTYVYKVHRERMEAYDAAWKLFLRGVQSWDEGRAESARRDLRESVRVEPRLAVAWSALGGIESSPREALRCYAAAVKADPTSEWFAEQLASAKRRAAGS
jgi:hypothetical protein